MQLPFLDRSRELERLERVTSRPGSTFTVLFGRRRCGKSRILRQVIGARSAIYYVGDDREPTLQRASLATEIGRVIEGFDQVTYPSWDALLDRLWRDAGPGTVVVLDELPAIVAASPELPSLLQKRIDVSAERSLHLVVAGSSQRMMEGLALDSSAPLYGRAQEIVKITPLEAGWIVPALSITDPDAAVRAFSVWGGVPRHWELAADHADLDTAIRELVLDPLGVLHEEPRRLLLDDMRDATQASSLLSVIGRGCHRLSEIAGRLGKPATSLGRPLRRLMEMDLIAREIPFGSDARSSKKTLYRVADPFLDFWFLFVEPNRSLLEVRRLDIAEADIRSRLPHHVARVWEQLARRSVPGLELGGCTWRPAARWWGAGLDRKPLELDIVAESDDGERLLVGAVKWGRHDLAARLLTELESKVSRFPLAQGRQVTPMLWLRHVPSDIPPDQVVTPRQVLDVLR